MMNVLGLVADTIEALILTEDLARDQVPRRRSYKIATLCGVSCYEQMKG
jgi:hypothetical protein